MFLKLIARHSPVAVAVFAAMAAMVSVTTPASAACWTCDLTEWPVAHCVPVPRPEGFVTCIAGTGACIMGDACQPYFSGAFDVDGRIASTGDQVSKMLIASATSEPSYQTFEEFLDGASTWNVLRTCKGLIMVRFELPIPEPTIAEALSF